MAECGALKRFCCSHCRFSLSQLFYIKLQFIAINIFVECVIVRAFKKITCDLKWKRRAWNLYPFCLKRDKLLWR